MEDLLSSFGGVEVTSRPNNPHAEHPHFALYKNKTTGSSQEERRKMVLQARKEARYDLLSLVRNLEGESEVTDESEGDMEYEEVRTCYARPKKFRNFLMLSEWLVDVPEDFASTYLALPCPVGKRCLVFSSKNSSICQVRCDGEGVSIHAAGRKPSHLSPRLCSVGLYLV